MDPTVDCPYCRKSFPLSDAVGSKYREHLKEEMASNYRRQFEEEKQQAITQTEKQNQLLKEELEQKSVRLKEAEAAEIGLRKTKNQLEEEKRTWELEKTRQLDRERGEIRAKTETQMAESFRLREAEFQKQASDLRAALEDAQRKAAQGSQQLQGEVQELDLKQLLEESFPADNIYDIEKGQRGADLKQVVRSAKGFECGIILWESKRTKAWSESWIATLKDNLRAEKAHIPVIVTQAFPKEAKTDLLLHEGVWLVSPRLAMALAVSLRDRLIEVAKQKYVSEKKDTAAEQVYEYVTGHEFVQQIQSLVEIYRDSIVQIGQERAAYEKIWKRREVQAQRLVTAAGRVYGSLQGLAGSSLPQVKDLELLESGGNE